MQGLHIFGKRTTLPNSQCLNGKRSKASARCVPSPACSQPRQPRAKGLDVAERVAAKPPAAWRVRLARLQGLSRRDWILVRPEAKTAQTGQSDAPRLRPDPRRAYARQLDIELNQRRSRGGQKLVALDKAPAPTVMDKDSPSAHPHSRPTPGCGRAIRPPCAGIRRSGGRDESASTAGHHGKGSAPGIPTAP